MGGGVDGGDDVLGWGGAGGEEGLTGSNEGVGVEGGVG